MQPTSNSDDEDRSVLIALQLYRLQAVRNMLLVVLLIQLVLLGIGLTLVLRANQLVPLTSRLSPNDSAINQGRGGIESHPDEFYRAPEKRQDVADDKLWSHASMSDEVI